MYVHSALLAVLTKVRQMGLTMCCACTGQTVLVPCYTKNEIGSSRSKTDYADFSNISLPTSGTFSRLHSAHTHTHTHSVVFRGTRSCPLDDNKKSSIYHVGQKTAPNYISNNFVKPRSILISFGTHVL